MQGLTLQNLQQMGATPVNPMPQTAQGMTLAQIQQMGGTPITPEQSPGVISQTIDQVKNDLSGTNPASSLSKGIAATSDVFGVVGQLPVLKQIGEVFGKGISAIGEKLSNLYSPKFQEELSSMSPEDYSKATQPLKDLQNLGTIANTILMAKGGQETAKGAKTVVDTAVKDVKSTIADPFGGSATNLSPEQMQAKLKGVSEDWKKPTTINEPKYNNARAVLAKDPEVTQNAAKMGLNPFSSIEDGKYNTKALAQQVRDDTGKLSRDILRPSLQMADYAVDRSSLNDLKPKVNDFGVTPDASEAIQARLSTKLDALQRKYPEGMSLTDMLDEKITYDKNGGYSQFKSNADTNDAIANRAVANTLRTQLIAKAPKDLPIEEFFAEQTKNYRVSDYLKSLDKVKAPVNPLQAGARMVAKFGGAKLGAIVGGDIVSSFAGYQIGKILESFVENMTNPMRDSFLQNLKVTNPEAFAQMEKFLGTAETTRATTLKLSPPTPLGTDKNPIITPSPTTYENPALKIRKQAPENVPLLRKPGENTIFLGSKK